MRIWKRIEQYRWECAQVLEGYHDRTIFSVSWGSGGTPGSLGLIASGSSDGQIIVYEVKVSSLMTVYGHYRISTKRTGNRKGRGRGESVDQESVCSRSLRRQLRGVVCSTRT